jgi:multicomponent Na+:H+ antiporter subunit B
MIAPSNSIIVIVVSRLLARLIQLFGIYVIVHGHYSPGGGFQGGALLAAGILLLRMTEGMEGSQSELSTSLGIPVAAIGALIFAVLGVVPIFFGGAYLDYGAIPIPGMEAAWVRHYGMLVVEVGIGLAVMTALVAIFDTLVGGPDDD